MTWTPTSSPTLRAAAAPASVAAFTDATSPRTMAVTSPASTFCQPTNATFAAFTMASAASIIPTRPRVSTRPSASPGSSLGMRTAILLRYLSPRCNEQLLYHGLADHHPHGIDQVGHDAGVIREHAHQISRPQSVRVARHPDVGMFLREPLDHQRLVRLLGAKVGEHHAESW